MAIDNLRAQKISLLNEIYRSSQEIFNYSPVEYDVSLYDADNEEFTFSIRKNPFYCWILR